MSFAKLRLITSGRNLYGGQDLNGCWHDSLNFSAKCTSMNPIFDIRKFRDYDATGDRYLSEMAGAIQIQNPGTTNLVIADSCHSGTITRGLGLGLMDIRHPTRNRFFNQGLPPRKIVNKVFSGPVTNHIVMSGCQPNGTCADAYINREYVGAFTFFAILALQKGMTYRQWFAEICKYLPSQDFEQIPMLEGPDYLLNRIVFDDETNIFHNSSHGSFIYDVNGDESDGQDETIYLDRNISDDEIGRELQKIRA
jgi:hypothetical protein